MKFKSSILSSVDNLTKGIIVLISFFFKYVKKFNYNVLLFVYVFNRQYLLKRFFLIADCNRVLCDSPYWCILLYSFKW
jgi:hypothetical protein